MSWNPTGWVALVLTSLVSGQNLPAAPDKPAIVFVHGIFDSGQKMAWMAAKFRAKGHETFCPDLTPAHGGKSLPELSSQLDAKILARFGARRRLVVVGFSMGGLVTRHWLQNHATLDRIAGFVTIGSPHNGSLLAHAWPFPGGADMRPGSPFLQSLQIGDERLVPLAPLSLYTPLDLMILPAWSSQWPIAETRPVWVPAHPLLVFSPEVVRHIEAYIRKNAGE